MKVGIQLYSVRDHIAEDPLATLKKVADMGYKYWETCPLKGHNQDYGLGMPAKEAKSFLDATGVKIVGSHVFRCDDVESLLGVYEYNKAIGNDKVGLSAHFFANRDDLLRKCEMYNRAGEAAQKYGMLFYYHNHFHEFQKFDGEYVMDLLLKNTDPKLVGFELDTYWAARGGMEPASLIEKYKDRLILLHQKDFPQNAGEPLSLFEEKVDPDREISHDVYTGVHKPGTFAEVGTGILDIQSYIDAGNRAGIPYILLEQDYTLLDEIRSIKISMDNFRRFRGIEWA